MFKKTEKERLPTFGEADKNQLPVENTTGTLSDSDRLDLMLNGFISHNKQQPDNKDLAPQSGVDLVLQAMRNRTMTSANLASLDQKKSDKAESESEFNDYGIRFFPCSDTSVNSVIRRLDRNFPALEPEPGERYIHYDGELVPVSETPDSDLMIFGT